MDNRSKWSAWLLVLAGILLLIGHMPPNVSGFSGYLGLVGGACYLVAGIYLLVTAKPAKRK